MTRTRDLLAPAALFHALSDETRLAIIERLRSGERCVCDLTDLLDSAQSRLSFHLKVLREAGIIDCRREGRWAYYWLSPDGLAELDDAVKALQPSKAATRRAACCS
ncbi:MAG: metalloregulator ArsR/SmtB family transcription factor [Gemmatimonadota bacterium]